ncbi:AAA family ATPase [Aquisalimonas asiatica]|uniref:ATP-dependent Clp protease ATP-binding subunit ClpX n=1 Tax=Aquisalimonas asiatica TaxID=406100 RepID=A0A1H8VCE1_9GAMM|nr:AAA family ATPase [Aquisalimonas asiatica]SEP12991.1 ATP-dependent Clp protease ATP-binding subunit ClpX [Aquisalimonas asiatica]
MDLSAFHPVEGESSYAICAFCRRGAEQVDELVAGHDAAMCGDCAAVLHDEVQEQRQAWLRDRIRNLPTPARIHGWLDERVVGQEQAKRVLAVQVHNHYKRLALRGMHDAGVVPGKANVLLSGPTGSGKTHLLRTLAHRLDVPFTVVDATTLTPAGHVGEGVEAIAQGLLRDCDWDPACAARGIVYIDEVDKLGGADADGNGVAVQQALLQLLEGRRIPVTGPRGGRLSMHTRDVLFVAGGAFTQAVETAAPAPGFVRPSAPGVADDPAQWLLRQGLIPELVGRFPIHAALDAVDIPAMRRLLVEPPDAPLRQMAALVADEGCALEVTARAQDQLASNAIARATGARGLRGEVERVMLDVLFELPGRADARGVVVDVVDGEVRAELQVAQRAAC